MDDQGALVVALADAVEDRLSQRFDDLEKHMGDRFESVHGHIKEVKTELDTRMDRIENRVKGWIPHSLGSP